MVLWATKYVDAAVARLNGEGHELRGGQRAVVPAQAARPELACRSSSTAGVPAADAVRPLRDAVELDDDDDGCAA